MTGTAVLTVSFMVMTVTSYRSVPEQTDSTPFITSIGHTVNPFGVAVSQDMLESGEICYGDTLVIDGFGNKVVNDTMNRRHKKHADIWVMTYEEEKRIGLRKRNVMIIRSPTRFCEKSEKVVRP